MLLSFRIFNTINREGWNIQKIFLLRYFVLKLSQNKFKWHFFTTTQISIFSSVAPPFLGREEKWTFSVYEFLKWKFCINFIIINIFSFYPTSHTWPPCFGHFLCIPSYSCLFEIIANGLRTDHRVWETLFNSWIFLTKYMWETHVRDETIIFSSPTNYYKLPFEYSRRMTFMFQENP
jgi:hypothetical protein